MSALLEVSGLTLRYGAVTALDGVDLAVAEGGAVALIGANGAGKTTLLRGLSGLLAPAGGRIRFDGRDLKGMPPHRIARRGIVQVPEGRQLFGNLHSGTTHQRRLTRAIKQARNIALLPFAGRAQ